jgi:type IV pilus assembly protein PilW
VNRPAPDRPGQVGFSLLELMVALTIGLLLLSGLLTIFNSAKQTYQWNTQLARLQENGRLAMELLTREIRHTGYWGCTGQSTPNNLLVTPNSLSWLTIDRLHGYDHLHPESLPSALNGLALPGNDVLILSGMDVTQQTLANHDACTAQFTLAQAHDLQADELVALSDCQQTVLVQITQANGSNRTLNHAASGGSIGNRSACLGGDCSGNCASAWYQFAPGTPLAPLRSIAFFIGNAASGEPALFWQLLYRGTNPSRTELVEGVENMQILYGLDSDGDRVANQYLRADQVETANGWNNIVSVRIALLLRSADPMRSQIDNKSYTLADTRVAPDTPLANHPADTRQRLLATSTIQLRD